MYRDATPKISNPHVPPTQRNLQGQQTNGCSGLIFSKRERLVLDETSYRTFVSHVEAKFNDFRKGVYVRAIEEDEHYQGHRTYYANTRKLDEFRYWYGYVRFLRDIYDHPFVQEMISTAKDFGAEIFDCVSEFDPKQDWVSADRIVENQKPFDDDYYRSVGFKKSVKEFDRGWQQVFIPLLKITEDDDGKTVIKAEDFNTIRTAFNALSSAFS